MYGSYCIYLKNIIGCEANDEGRELKQDSMVRSNLPTKRIKEESCSSLELTEKSSDNPNRLLNNQLVYYW